MEDTKLTHDLAVTLTLNPIILVQLTPKQQTVITMKKLKTLLTSTGKPYRFITEYTKAGNFHVHGIINNILKEDFDNFEQTIKTMINSITIPAKTINNNKVNKIYIKLFGNQICLKKVFTDRDWNHYMDKNQLQTKYIMNRIACPTEYLQIEKTQHDIEQLYQAIAAKQLKSNNTITYPLNME